MPDEYQLGDYVEVHERIKKFAEKHPEGSLQGRWDIVALPFENKGGELEPERTHIVYEAMAYRTPDDPRPGIGMASEPVPGLTPYTKGSELMNAETSAWGRALAAIGIEVHAGIASANEVRARTGGTAEKPKGFASDKQKDFLRSLLGKANANQPETIVAYLGANFDGSQGGGISRAIDKLKKNPKDTAEELDALAETWAAENANADVPVDDADLPSPDAEGTEQQTL
jgi:hypothetical protein